MHTVSRPFRSGVVGLALLGLASLPALAQNDVTLEKATNGQDADSPPGPALLVGDPVTWTYTVTNTGSRELFFLEVTDDQGVTVSCPGTSLGPGESMVCTANGTVEAGQYANVGTVTGLLPNETLVSDTDPSHYFGQQEVALDLEKATNGFDADTPPGPTLPVGATATWTYEVTNVGSEPLGDVEVTDDQGVTVSCPSTTLAVGESMICTAAGTVVQGQYANVGSVTALLPDESGVAAADPSHHFGQVLLLEKSTEGEDADSPPGPLLEAGDTVTWTYEVTNPGPETVTNVAVTDDQGVTVTCPSTTLAAGESVVCTGSDTVQFGQYANVGTATAELPLGGVVSATDPSHYAGMPLGIQKRTNGEDADSPPGPTVLVGSAVAWTYEVTNFGDETLTDVSVTDDQGVTVTCPGTTLGPGESMTCTADGTAEAGQYANVGTATAEDPEIGTITATDPSHYLGQEPPLLDATKTAALVVDENGDGIGDLGDVLEYTIVIENTGEASATGVTFSDTPDPHTSLVTGTVTTSLGSVTVGNGAGDTSVLVDVGELPGSGGTATITYRVEIGVVPAGVTEVVNQGVVSADELPDLLTDDPGQPGSSDPTVHPVSHTSVLEIPTLGSWGLLVSLLALGFLGWRRLASGT